MKKFLSIAALVLLCTSVLVLPGCCGLDLGCGGGCDPCNTCEPSTPDCPPSPHPANSGAYSTGGWGY